MKTLNPNFPVPDEIAHKLDRWFGEDRYTPLICWYDYDDRSAYFVVVKTEAKGFADPTIHMVRLYKAHDFQSDDPINNYDWALSIDAQESCNE